jgi:RNA polymerase sigma factor (sigma-70 family)
MSEEAAEPRTGVQAAVGLAGDAAQRLRLVTYAGTRFEIPESEAEDLLQETQLELLRTEALLHRPEGFVFQVFHRRCCQHVRRTLVERRAALGALASRPTDTPPRLDDEVLLREGLSRISESCRRILVAYYVEGRSLRETAEAFLVPAKSVYTIVNQCLRRLRRCLMRR